MLERTIADFREHLPEQNYDDFVKIAMKMVSDEKRAYYIQLTKVAWDSYTATHKKNPSSCDHGPVLKRHDNY